MLKKDEVGLAYPEDGDPAVGVEAEQAEVDEGEAQAEEEQAAGVLLEENNDELLGGDEGDGDEDFWVDFDLDGVDLDQGPKETFVSTRAYYAYRLQIRAISQTDSRSYFWLFGRLLRGAGLAVLPPLK
ncbi:unnamed protein product [Mortierella alpina]